MTMKKDLRKEILGLMKNQQKSQKDDYDFNLHEQLYAHYKYQNAKSVAIVMSMDHEVDTLPIIQKILKDNKKVYVPTTNYNTKMMKFQRLTDLESIAIDEKGIKFIDKETEIEDNIDLIIVPGVVFNNEGYRIGYGGGYYDKFLSQYSGDTLSLVYPFQIKSFEYEEHDIPVEEIILPNVLNGEE
ncbi:MULTISPECIES: 5-formyltetrahydrofolate cyclo-ligase [Mammaliicoccus]|uniref:5-formyltetrahydrofolate cyclo-ligase n=2 Tax=Staphylococcaceae TaxID=90964 RepID=A0ABS5MKL3_9STAP|nr:MULTISPECIES: 5-formyltetrahydrofolate cyclo-ligase [Mammaliicoccus]MBL0846209.1 5-formyltetrahydrofolate cyclo-ligase [Mammaliicoccus fleurettii]MBO3062429.1 5-formyltetrahydrofolate cyclo-ligase [Mammaliicoccus fleurettii]MBS3671190.1 5-formyltetrahydrofolate cyclo-ligase [Mammaliicoccus fleurettii]MBS3696436.1 5-formyltetrahydrofolate cyclo-ligase [Mammaliicoccus fleurettii]MBW0764115.1 5-formyltetrahydrofolate cyclo-ligase [Mammaliicoccus fleurettii]